MPIVVSIDGQLHCESEATVSVFDRGFLYGDSVFETIRTYDGVPYALSPHLERLKRSADSVFIPVPIGLTELAEEVLATTRAAQNPESYVRIMLTRGIGHHLGLDPNLAERPARIIIVGPLQTLPDSVYEQGAAVVTYRTQRIADATPAAGAKISNYLIAVMGMRQARACGAVEALIVDAKGCVVEGASSNLFMLHQGTLVTPGEDAGILPGITRSRVLDLADELKLEVRFRAPSVAELVLCDEVFISSTIRELVPVVRVDGQVIGSGAPGPITQLLLQRFRERVKGLVPPANA
jgi:branched-chain amino acid aminotransferase